MNEKSISRCRYLCSAVLLAGGLLGLTLAVVRAGSLSPQPQVFLRLQVGTFDPLQQSPPLPDYLDVSPRPASPYAIVQFEGPVRPEWQVALLEAGVRVLDYLPDYAYVVRLSTADELPTADLATLARLPGVRWTGELLPAYRLDPALWQATDQLTLTIQLFPDENPAAVHHIDGVQVLETIRTDWQTTLRLRADGAALPALAALPGVRWIEPAPVPGPVNDVVAGLTGVTETQNTLGLTGTGQVIAVADTGLDVGTSGVITDFAGRIVATHCLGRPSPCLWDDPHGHGTHVAGSAAGSGALSGGQFRGMAPGAGLVVQSLYSPTQANGLYIPADLNPLFAPAYTDGARIHNDSWGSVGNRYDTWAQTADQFIWDHPDMLVVVAAGNGGIDRGLDGLIDPGSLYSPATAKNVLAVGASESLRTGQGYTGDYGHSPTGANFPADPVHSDTISDEPWGLAAFSSRGPTPDNRIRPDLVAPGTNILSARSHHPAATYPQTYNADYAFYSGSSQAAPLVSGAAALTRQWYATQEAITPSAALLHATLIHGAADLAPGQYGTALTGTVVSSDDVEGTYVWTSTTWVVTGTYGTHSPTNAWVAQGAAPGFRRLDATLNLSGATLPQLLFWNRRLLDGSTARIYACGSQRVLYDPNHGGQIGWAQEAISITTCAGVTNALVRFELQCTSGCGTASPDFWAVDDITIADGARLAEITPPPDPGQGWGRLDLVGSLLPQPSTSRWLADISPGLQTGESLRATVTVTDTSVPLRATLVWSDYPASPAAAVALVNDLDLVLETPSGEAIHPNGLSSPDRTNIVEQVTVQASIAGSYQLVVHGYNIPFGPQPFALVVTAGGQVLPQQVYLPLVLR
ncbi:MAG: S8 family serine peptidase [Anaerolineae bacterium]|nr:S8 family serine peptidase [Anaerolineae bacterium]